MKTLFTISLILYMLSPVTSLAALYNGPESKACFTGYATAGEQEACLSLKKKESEAKLAEVIAETVRRIKANNVGDFNGKEDAKETYGDVYSRRFLAAQIKWKQYRDELCLAVATELNEDAYDYQLFIDQCEINLNKRHIEEIHLMELPPVR